MMLQTPVAVHRVDVVRGAGFAWLAFLILLFLLMLTTTVVGTIADGTQSPGANVDALSLGLSYAFFAVVFALLPSAAVTAVGTFAAALLAHALRRVRSIPVHLAAYTGVGAAIGLAYCLAVTGGNPLAAWPAAAAFLLPPAVASTVAVPLGWYCNLRYDRMNGAS